MLFSQILISFIFIVPLDGLSIKEIRLSNVDFPDPEGPVKEYILPYWKTKLIFFKTLIFLKKKNF